MFIGLVEQQEQDVQDVPSVLLLNMMLSLFKELNI
jgi:hypothetical protein